MKKFWIFVLFVAAFLLGDSAAIERANRHYQPILKKLQNKNKTLRVKVEVLSIQRKAWAKAAKCIDHGCSRETVFEELKEAHDYANLIKRSM